jgi:hypothetical protein
MDKELIGESSEHLLVTTLAATAGVAVTVAIHHLGWEAAAIRICAHGSI